MVDFVEPEYADDPIPHTRRVPVEDELRKVLRERAGAYHRLFAGARRDDIDIVMQDLAHFCRAYESGFSLDDRTTNLILGRQEVFRRIVEFARLNNDELFFRYHQRMAEKGNL